MLKINHNSVIELGKGYAKSFNRKAKSYMNYDVYLDSDTIAGDIIKLQSLTNANPNIQQSIHNTMSYLRGIVNLNQLKIRQKLTYVDQPLVTTPIEVRHIPEFYIKTVNYYRLHNTQGSVVTIDLTKILRYMYLDSNYDLLGYTVTEIGEHLQHLTNFDIPYNACYIPEGLDGFKLDYKGLKGMHYDYYGHRVSAQELKMCMDTATVNLIAGQTMDYLETNNINGVTIWGASDKMLTLFIEAGSNVVPSIEAITTVEVALFGRHFVFDNISTVIELR